MCAPLCLPPQSSCCCYIIKLCNHILLSGGATLSIIHHSLLAFYHCSYYCCSFRIIRSLLRLQSTVVVASCFMLQASLLLHLVASSLLAMHSSITLSNSLTLHSFQLTCPLHDLHHTQCCVLCWCLATLISAAAGSQYHSTKLNTFLW